MNAMPTLPLDVGCRAVLAHDCVEVEPAIEFFVGHTSIWVYRNQLEHFRYEPGHFQAAVEKLVRETPRVHGCAYP